MAIFRPKNILFLCTGNSCRSQMAEAWARELGGDHFEVQSAGIEAHGKNPKAIEIMREAGIDISGQESTMLSERMLGKADVVVTVCGHADEMCPALPPTVRKVHWPLSDPAKATGTHEKIMDQFRVTRDEIEGRVSTLISQLKQELKDEPAK
jgi:arsenate reductase